ncbi:hypothetical protein M8494_35600 [Serratia ureilytica]
MTSARSRKRTTTKPTPAKDDLFIINTNREHAAEAPLYKVNKIDFCWPAYRDPGQ